MPFWGQVYLCACPGVRDSSGGVRGPPRFETYSGIAGLNGHLTAQGIAVGSRLSSPPRATRYRRRTKTSILPRDPMNHDPSQPVIPTISAVRKADQKPPQI